MDTPLHVAVGVIQDERGRVLVALRHSSQHQGGLWEFPGGKLELGESAEAALTRELSEELGIDVLRAEPFLQLTHAYSDRSVLLDCWLVLDYRGEPQGRESQPLAWRAVSELVADDFPTGNKPIIDKLKGWKRD